MPLSTLKNELFLTILLYPQQYKTPHISQHVYADTLNQAFCD